MHGAEGSAKLAVPEEHTAVSLVMGSAQTEPQPPRPMQWYSLFDMLLCLVTFSLKAMVRGLSRLFILACAEYDWSRYDPRLG